MRGCPAFSAQGGIADALRSVDCMTARATETAFGRLFGAGGSLGTALTITLTIYVAILAISVLTGRSRLSVSTLAPRMMTLGMVLTFATSWVAYQSVLWNLAAGGPDEIASILVGSSGSATSAFAGRLDLLFAAVAEAAAAVQPSAADKARMFSPADLLWLSSLMLLLGTVGVLVTARITLAALLGLGPVFIAFALFGGTRGLFEGWLKGVVIFALVPLFTVLIGGGALAMLSPIVADIAASGGDVSLRASVTLFLGASVYVALMLMVIKLATTICAGWSLPLWPAGSQPAGSDDVPTSVPAGYRPIQAEAVSLPTSQSRADPRIQQLLSVTQAPSIMPPVTERLRNQLRVPFEAAPIVPSRSNPIRLLQRQLGTPSTIKEQAR
jgi:type IV secretion system protein VirB6